MRGPRGTNAKKNDSSSRMKSTVGESTQQKRKYQRRGQPLCQSKSLASDDQCNTETEISELSALSQEIETSHEIIDYVSPKPMVAIPSGILNSFQHNIEYVL